MFCVDLSAVPERQPFKLALFEEFLRLCGDPGYAAFYSDIDSFANSVTMGVGREMRKTPAVFSENSSGDRMKARRRRKLSSGATTQVLGTMQKSSKDSSRKSKSWEPW